MTAVGTARATPTPVTPGELVRKERQARRLTLVQLGELTGYSAAQISRYERGICPMTDVDVLRRFADALGIPHQAVGLVPAPEPPTRHGQPTGIYPHLPAPRLGIFGREDGEDPVERRKLLNLAVTAAAAGAPVVGGRPAMTDAAQLGDVLIAGLRDAMLGLGGGPSDPAPDQLPTELARTSTR